MRKQRRTGKYYKDVENWLEEKGLSIYKVSVVLGIDFKRFRKLVTCKYDSKVRLEDALKLYYFSEGELKLEQILGRQCIKPNTTYKTLLGQTNTKSDFEKFVEDTKKMSKLKN